MMTFRSWRCGILACAWVSVALAPLHAQDLLQKEFGTQTNEFFGAEVAYVKDVDSDNSQDFAIASTGANNFDGKVTFYSGSTLQPFTVLNAPDIGASFGSRIIEVGDVNDDSYVDVVIASPGYSATAQLSGLGRVRLYSGKWIATGQGDDILALYTGLSFFGNPTAVGDFLGTSLEDLGDMDGDFESDYGIGARDVGGTGYVLLKSSDNPLVGLGVLFGNAIGDEFGSSITRMGDLDNDGDREFAIGASQRTNGGPGYVEVFDYPNVGVPLYTLQGDNPGDQFGAASDWLWSVTPFDTEHELIVGAPGGNYVKVFDGETGVELYRLDGDAAGDRFGAAVAKIPDWDGDGSYDILVGAPGNSVNPQFPKPGYVRCFSGRTGAFLWTLQGDPSTAPNGASDEFGAAIASLTDVTGDFVADFLVGAPADDDSASQAGTAGLYSGNPPVPFLTVDNTEVSVSAGGTIGMTMYSDASHAGETFLVLGSLSGVSPGFDIDGFNIPLNVDSYFNLTLTDPNTPLGGLGIVANDGIDQASLTAGPGQLIGFEGLTIYHAHVTWSGVVTGVSNSVSTLFNF